MDKTLTAHSFKVSVNPQPPTLPPLSPHPAPIVAKPQNAEKIIVNFIVRSNNVLYISVFIEEANIYLWNLCFT